MCKIKLGENIRRWRQFRGFQQAEFAEKLNVSSATLSKYENGRTDICISVLLQITNLLMIDVKDLLKEHQGFLMMERA